MDTFLQLAGWALLVLAGWLGLAAVIWAANR